MADLRGYVEGMIGFDGDGTNVVANPTGTPTDNLETIQIGDVIYNVYGGGEEIVPTPTNADRSKYLGVKSDANELEYRAIREVPNSDGVDIGNVLTHTVNGDVWLAPDTELPSYSTAQNNKVLGVHNGELEWVDQSGGGGVNYSTEEQDTGLLWYDGRHIYQRTFYIANPVNDRRTSIDTLIGADKVIEMIGTVDREVSGLGTITYSINTHEDNNYWIYIAYDKYSDNISYNMHFAGNTGTNLTITIKYVKPLS